MYQLIRLCKRLGLVITFEYADDIIGYVIYVAQYRGLKVKKYRQILSEYDMVDSGDQYWSYLAEKIEHEFLKEDNAKSMEEYGLE